MVNFITEHIDIWTAAQMQKANGGRGRGKNSNGQSPHGIKKLRELILELAIRGKLVPQDPNDEPASVLLEKIAKEKARLIKINKIKKLKALPEIIEEEKPFELPNEWKWTRLGSISQISPRNEVENNLTVSFIPMTLISTSHTGEHGQEIKTWGEIKKGYTHFADGDIGVAKITPCFENSKAVVLSGLENGIGAGTTELHIARPFGTTLTPRYILLFLKAPMFLHVGKTKMTGTAGQKRVPKEFFSETPLPLPPLAEQHRIVSKVDELMALCDELEQQQTDSNATHQTLFETLLATLTDAADQREFSKAWQRIANHFDTLFTTEQSIDQLKQTILQLAVMGKLVLQDPNDESASDLLEKIDEERKRLIKEGKIKKQKPLPEISEEERPFKLPRGWNFVRLVALSKLITKGSSPKWQGVAYTKDTEDVLFVTSENVGSYVLKLDSKKYVEKKFNEVEPRSILQKGDFLMNIVGASIGRTAIYNIDDLANINQAVCLIRVFPQFLDSQYLLHFFNSEICVSYMFDKQVDNARANLSMGNIAKFVIPFPPLAEQRRIVAKVDTVMDLCDTFKARLNVAQTTQVQLADAIVEQAVA